MTTIGVLLVYNSSSERVEPDSGLTESSCSRLRILATSDLHMNLLGYDYYADRADDRIGLIRIAQLIRAARAEADAAGMATLLLDNGDALHGTPLDTAARDQDPHPLMLCFAALGYDAIGLGNHDFDFGIDRLAVMLQAAPCPVLCSNMHPVAGQPELPFQASALLTRSVTGDDGRSRQLRIGLLSLLPPQTLDWNSHLLGGRVRIDDMVDSARHQADALRAAKADLVIALAHTGLGPPTYRPNLENALSPLADLPELDAIIAGHTHLVLPNAAEADLPTPTVMPGSAGSHLGQIDLTLRHDGTWHLTEARPALHAVSSLPARAADARLTRLLTPLHQKTRSRLQQVVGHTDQPLHSYFSFFAPDRSLACVAAAQAAALRPILARTPLKNLPLLSAAAPTRFGGRAGPGHYTDIPAGPVLQRHLTDLHAFPNLLRCVCLTGAQVLDWLEMSAGLFHQIPRASQDHALIDPNRAGHNFDVIHGLTYAIDLSAPARFNADGTLTNPCNRRIRSACYNGTPLSPNTVFAVATNSYRANGGGNFTTLKHAEHIHIPDLSVADILRSYLSGSPQDPAQSSAPPWTFCPLPNTRVTVQTGPGAQRYLPKLAERLLKPAQLDDDGFLALTLAL
jgi:2',3'-cyclic-nucleotide 2'-phosphodiesterase / 3'-nucleotidase